MIIVKKITYKLKFTDSYGFMQSKLLDFVDNLSEINKKECPKCKGKCEFIGFKNDRLRYRCKECKKTCTKSKDRLIKKFPNIYKFCNGDLNKFVLLLRKVVYPYECIDSWKRFDETSLLHKEAFYSELNLEDITDKDYEHVQKLWEVFEIKNLGDYHGLYVQSNTSLLADVFENFKDKCIEIYELDHAHSLSAPGLACQACLKKTKVILELLTDIDMLLIIEKVIRGGICQAIHRHAKANNKCMKNYNKDIISSYLMYLDANDLYGWAMSQKLPVNGFEWVEKSRLSRFNERFIKNYIENTDIGYFFQAYVDYLKELFNLHKDLPFLPERKKVNKCKKIICSIEDKEKYVVHIRVLKQDLNDGLILKKIHRVIKFNQEHG